MQRLKIHLRPTNNRIWDPPDFLCSHLKATITFTRVGGPAQPYYQFLGTWNMGWTTVFEQEYVKITCLELQISCPTQFFSSKWTDIRARVENGWGFFAYWPTDLTDNESQQLTTSPEMQANANHFGRYHGWWVFFRDQTTLYTAGWLIFWAGLPE